MGSAIETIELGPTRQIPPGSCGRPQFNCAVRTGGSLFPRSHWGCTSALGVVFVRFFHVQPKHQDGAIFVNIDYLEHRNRGSTRTLLAPLHRASLTAKQESPSAPSARTHRRHARTTPPRRTSAPRTARVAANPPPQHQPQPQDRSARTHAALRRTSTAPARLALPPAAAPPAPDLTHKRRRTTMKRCCVPE